MDRRGERISEWNVAQQQTALTLAPSGQPAELRVTIGFVAASFAGKQLDAR